MTPDEIAREAAESFVVVKEWAPNPIRPHETWPFLFINSRPTEEIPGGDCPQSIEGHYRQDVADLVRGAIERALRCVPVPGGLSEERLAQIRDAHRKGGPRMEPLDVRYAELLRPLYEAIGELLDHADHLVRILQDASADGQLDQWRAGYEAGVKAEREKALVLRGDP